MPLAQMILNRLGGVCVAVCSLASAGNVAAQPAPGPGRLEGVVIRQDGSGVGGVLVLIEELGQSELTDATGKYAFGRLAAGSYSVLSSLGPRSLRQSGVVISSRATTTLRTVVDWPLNVFESVLVNGTTRLPERMVEAPAAVTVVGSDELAAQALHGQLPRLLAATPGVEFVQSGLYDFNLNSRGFNTFYNRHVLTRIDGRDPSLPTLLGHVDWATLSYPLDDIDQLELVRGPGAALYGEGAFNGIMNLRTKAPRDSLGGRARYTVGELDTHRIEFREAAALGRGWYLKGEGGYHRSGDFTRSRLGKAEYAPATLPRDLAAPAPLDKVRLSFGSVRIDKYTTPERLLTFELGTAHEEGPVKVSPVGRIQATDSDSPWFRVNFAAPRWNVLGYYSGNRMDATRNLTANALIYLHSSQSAIEAQTNRQFAGARGRVVIGLEFGGQTLDSADPNGVQTAYDRKRSTTYGSVFGQIEYRFTERLNGVGSARWDRSTLHAGRVSPRVAAVYTLAPSQTVRVTYGRAFQAANLTEYFLSLPVAPPIDLSPVEAALKPVIGNTSLELQNVPILALGNNHLRVEQVDSIEVGYQGVVRGRLLVSASVYRNQLKDFITYLLPQVGTSLGRLNSSFGPYAPPSGLSPAAAAIVKATLEAALPLALSAALSNDATGRPIIAMLSFSNFGSATTVGVELAATYLLPAGWRIQGSYTGFHSNVSDIPENPLLPNTPGHQFSAGTAYARTRFSSTLRYRWVDSFQWLAGIYVGPVPSYGVVDLNGSYRLTEHITAGADVANLLDRDHYEAFGGDLLRRRALVHLTYSW
jgi:outer membrane receptor protein involved in Fe transport